MTEAVLDASVVLKWFGGRGEDLEAEALAMRATYVEGNLVVLAPALLALEVLSAAAPSDPWTDDAGILDVASPVFRPLASWATG